MPDKTWTVEDVASGRKLTLSGPVLPSQAVIREAFKRGQVKEQPPLSGLQQKAASVVNAGIDTMRGALWGASGPEDSTTAKLATIAAMLPMGKLKGALSAVKEGEAVAQEGKGLAGALKAGETAAEDYRGLHGAPMRDSGAPLHKLNGDVYPDDVYSANGMRYYGDSSPHDARTFSIVNQFKGNPNSDVMVYRAVPEDTSAQIARLEKRQREIMRRGSANPKEYETNHRELAVLRAKPADTPKAISPGDWVTVNRGYARDHGESALNGQYQILSKRVKARDIFTNGDSIHEWGYDPQPPVVKTQEK